MNIIERIESCRTGQELAELAASYDIQLDIEECEKYVETLELGDFPPELFGSIYCEPIHFQSLHMRNRW